MVLDPEVKHRNRNSNSEGKVERSPASDMSVIFPDGTVIAEKTAVETLVAVVRKIGVAEVRSVVEDYNLKFCRVPVISNRIDAKYGRSQRDLENALPESNVLDGFERRGGSVADDADTKEAVTEFLNELEL